MYLIRHWLPQWVLAISLGNSWWDQKKKKPPCFFIVCLYGLLFNFYYQFKISFPFFFFFWPFHKWVKIALHTRKEKETESKARCTRIKHTLEDARSHLPTGYPFLMFQRLPNTSSGTLLLVFDNDHFTAKKVMNSLTPSSVSDPKLIRKLYNL